MSEQETRGGGFDRLLKAALDGDDAEALDTVMAAVRGVACRAGAYYRFPATECDDFAQWACEDLLKRLRNARRKGKRSDPLTYALDVVAERHADKDWEAQKSHFLGLIGNFMFGTAVPDYWRQVHGGQLPTVPIDDGERPIDPPAPIPPKNEDAEKTLQRFEAWIAGQNIRVRAIYHLRHYFLLNDLPNDVSLHLRDVHAGLGDEAIPGLNGAPDAEAVGAALDTLLQNAQLVDGMGRVRWEIVAWLLGRPRNLLEVCWCHAKKEFKRQLREGGEDA